jgi:HSP20 family molecular chaperone IbpA
MSQKRSFFERLTGSVPADEVEIEEVEESRHLTPQHDFSAPSIQTPIELDGELTVDVYQTPNEIIIKTMVAGVRPEDLDINITRDMVTIKGKREAERLIRDDDYYHRELYWGSFSRAIALPQEVEIEEAEAIEKHGLLIIKLPKLDKSRQTKLKVKNII